MFFPSVGQQETKTQIFDGRVNFKRDPWWTAHRTFFLKNKRQKKFLIGQTANLLWMQQWLVAIPLFHSWSRENCIKAPCAIISLVLFFLWIETWPWCPKVWGVQTNCASGDPDAWSLFDSTFFYWKKSSISLLVFGILNRHPAVRFGA